MRKHDDDAERAQRIAEMDALIDAVGPAFKRGASVDWGQLERDGTLARWQEQHDKFLDMMGWRE